MINSLSFVYDHAECVCGLKILVNLKTYKMKTFDKIFKRILKFRHEGASRAADVIFNNYFPNHYF